MFPCTSVHRMKSLNTLRSIKSHQDSSNFLRTCRPSPSHTGRLEDPGPSWNAPPPSAAPPDLFTAGGPAPTAHRPSRAYLRILLRFHLAQRPNSAFSSSECISPHPRGVCGDLPASPVVENLPTMQGTWVRSLVKELRFPTEQLSRSIQLLSARATARECHCREEVPRAAPKTAAAKNRRKNKWRWLKCLKRKRRICDSVTMSDEH